VAEPVGHLLDVRAELRAVRGARDASIVSDLLIAGAGGIAGAVLVGVGRLTTIPDQVAANDADAAEINRALEAWAFEQVRRWRADRKVKTQRISAAGTPRGGAHAQMMVATNEIALRAASRALTDARRRLAAVRSREDWTHALWRRLRRRPFDRLEAEQRIEPVLDAWRKPVAVNASTVEVVDATRRSVADSIADVRGG